MVFKLCDIELGSGIETTRVARQLRMVFKLRDVEPGSVVQCQTWRDGADNEDTVWDSETAYLTAKFQIAAEVSYSGAPDCCSRALRFSFSHCLAIRGIIALNLRTMHHFPLDYGIDTDHFEELPTELSLDQPQCLTSAADTAHLSFSQTMPTWAPLPLFLPSLPTATVCVLSSLCGVIGQLVCLVTFPSLFTSQILLKCNTVFVLCLLSSPGSALPAPTEEQPLGRLSTRLSTRQSNHMWTVYLKGWPNTGYCAMMRFGVNKQQKFCMIVDTGSANTAVAATADPALTTEFYDVNSHGEDFEDMGKSVTVTYSSGKWTGTLVRDKVGFDDFSMDKGPFSLITYSVEFFIEGADWAGILGLAYQSLAKPKPEVGTVWDSLRVANQFQDVFSMQLCPPRESTFFPGTFLKQESYMTLGGLNSSLYKINKPIYYTKIVQERFFNVLLTSIWVGGTKIDLSCKEFNNDKTIVDSGTTDIYFPIKVFEEIKTSFTDFFKDGLPMAIPEEFWSGERKLLWRAEYIEEIYQCFPTLYLGMADEEDSSQEFSLAIVPQLYLRQIDVQAGEIDPAMCPHYSPCDAFTFGVKPRAQGTVIGANAMLGYYTVFDRENGRVGFAESTCDFRSLESSPYISGPHARDPEDCETPGPPDHWDKITYYCGAITITLAALMTAITVTVQAKRCFKARCSNMKCVSRSTTLPKRMADKIKTGHRMALESCCGRMLHCSNSDSHTDVTEDFAQPVQSSDVGPTAEAVVLHSSSLEDESNNELIVPTSRPQQAVAMARSSGAEMVGFEPKTLLEKKAGGNAVAMPSHDNRRESKRKRKKRHPVMETEIPQRDHDTLCIDCDRPRHKPPLAATDRAHSGNSAIVYDNREYQNNIKPYSLFV